MNEETHNVAIKFCKECGKEISCGRQFCSQSCAAKYNNKNRKVTDRTKRLQSVALMNRKQNGSLKEVYVEGIGTILMTYKEASYAYYEGELSFEFIKENFPILIHKCKNPECNKEFVVKISKNTNRPEKSDCCSKECSKKKRQLTINSKSIKTKKPRYLVLTDEEKEKIQSIYDEIGNVKKVAKITHVSAKRLQTFLVYKENRNKKETFNINEYSKTYRTKVKDKCLSYKGGECMVCGYDRYYGALEFHHVNPEEKDFTISGGTKCFEYLKPELDKCMVVCSNCHKEIHAGLINPYDYVEMIDSKIVKKNKNTER